MIFLKSIGFSIKKIHVFLLARRKLLGQPFLTDFNFIDLLGECRTADAEDILISMSKEIENIRFGDRYIDEEAVIGLANSKNPSVIPSIVESLCIRYTDGKFEALRSFSENNTLRYVEDKIRSAAIDVNVYKFGKSFIQALQLHLEGKEFKVIYYSEKTHNEHHSEEVYYLTQEDADQLNAGYGTNCNPFGEGMASHTIPAWTDTIVDQPEELKIVTTSGK